MSEVDSSILQRKLSERRAERVAAEAKAQPPATYDDLVPPQEEYVLSDSDRELDAAVDGVTILQAVTRYGTMVPKVLPGQVESIKFSCIAPEHDDKDPSAWLNTQKNVWECGTCHIGGDVHELAALYHGYSLDTFKQGKTFGKLRRQIAEDFGYQIHRIPGGETYIIPPVVEDDTPAPSVAVTPVAPVVGIPSMPPIQDGESDDEPEDDVPPVLQMVPALDPSVGAPDDEDRNSILIRDIPKLDWKSITPEDSFLDAYMQATIIDDVPEEYHFWNALIALGFAIGRQVRLYDTREVYGNLFVCTLGPSGSGKSKAASHLKSLLGKALPYDAGDPESRGVHRISSPGSAESLITYFQKPILDPANPKKIIGNAPVSGLIDFNELSGLVGRANRSGSVLKPTLMEFYDADDTVSSGSLASGLKEANKPFASALTTTQPAALRTLLGAHDDDSGFLNRWVFVAGPPKKRVAVGGARIDVTSAVNPLKAILAWSGSFRDDDFMEWSPEALTAFTEFFDNVLEKDKASSESAMLTRVDLLMKKIILLLASNRREKMASGQTVRDAISLYPYIKACYSVPEREIRNTLANEVGDTIMQTLDRYQASHEGKGPTMRELTKLLWRKNYPRDMITKTLDVLVKLGLVASEVVVTTSRGGRPTERYRYVG